MSSVSTRFDSIEAFSQYFENIDTLTVPADQALEIRNVEILFSSKAVDKKDLNNLGPLKQAAYLINQILVPIGKEVSLSFEEGRFQGSYTLLPHLTLSSSTGFTLTLDNDCIVTRAHTLFLRMIQTSRLTQTFTPGKQLKMLGVYPDFSSEKTIGEHVLDIFSWHIPLGYSFSIESQNYTLQRGHITEGLQFATLSSLEGFTLKLKNTFTFNSIWGFRQYMRHAFEIDVPPNQELKIDNIDLAVFNNGPLQKLFQPLGAALTKALVSLGKGVSVNGVVQWKLDGKTLIMESEEGFSITTSSKHFFTNLRDLSSLLIDDKRFSCTLQPGQKLWIYDVDEIDEELSKWLNSKDKNVIHSEIVNFLCKRNPIGFNWGLKYTGSLNYRVITVSNSDKEGLRVFEITSPNEIELYLAPASEDWLMMNIISDSSPKLSESLIDGEIEGINFLLLRVFFYFCCGCYRDWKYTELPSTFKGETQEKIDQLLKDENFSNALKQLFKNEETYSKIVAILLMTPDEFNSLKIEEQPPYIHTILKELLAIVYTEAQGGKFVTEEMSKLRNALIAKKSS